MGAMPDFFLSTPSLAETDGPTCSLGSEHTGASGVPTICIIGGGFSGTATAIKLLNGATEPLMIKIIEKRAELGRGLAYSTREPQHVMNGPAKVFSLYPERPDHFVRFLARYGREWGWHDPAAPDFANAHASRWLFGDYVRGELARAVANAAPGVSLQHIIAEAADVQMGDGGAVITLADGTALHADQVVMALGLFLGQPNISIDPALKASGLYVDDPWDIERLRALKRRGRVLLIGSGLTMLDAVVSLERHGHRGSYLAISRHGFGLHPRRDVMPLSDFLGEQKLPTNVLSLLRLARAELANMPNTRPDWQALVMAIRPYMGVLWQRAPLTERQRFLRHLRRIWEISLHRAAPQVAQVLERGRIEGWFVHRAGRLQALRSAGDGRVAVDVTWRKATGATTEIVDAAVNCTGAQYAWPLIKGRKLVTNLMARGLVRPGPLGFGIDADINAGVIGQDGRRSQRLTAIGAPLRGVTWESNSVSELLQQSIVLAEQLLNRVHATRFIGSATHYGLEPK
jgi:uncharacterized NAD(P)/FAD-binding protein YdhS